MDWVTLLLIFIFFVLPLAQQLLEQARRGRTPPGEEMPDEYLEEPDPVRLERPAPSPRVEREVKEESVTQGSWSGEWGSWPAPDEEQVALQRIEEREREMLARRMPRSREPEPEVTRSLPETPSAEAEIVRAPRALTVKKVAGVPARPSETRPAKRKTQPPATVISRSSIASRLGNAGELRKAIILAEVLGPPVALKGEKVER
jgi:hypothetical protein